MTSASYSRAAEGGGDPGRARLEYSMTRAMRRWPSGVRRNTKSAAPFPNICVDDFLPENVAHALSAAFPSHDDIGWIERDNKNNRRPLPA